jgi:predicted dehydrogenase
MATCDELVGQVDGVVVTARHGNKHYEFAKPYIASGVPMFIDKPITIHEDEAVAFMQELKENNIPVTGGSMLRFNWAVRQVGIATQEEVAGKTIGGVVRAPLYPTNPNGGFYFYAQHLVEMVMTGFGRFPQAVQCCVDGSLNRVVLFHYENFTVTGYYTNGGNEYYAARFSRLGTQGGYVATNTGEAQLAEFREFAQLMYEGGKMVLSYEELIAPVFVMNAIERAAVSGNLEPVCYGVI